MISLVRNRQTGGGALAIMAPWLVTMAVVGGAGAALAASGVPTRLLGEPNGMYATAAITAALLIAGLVWTMRRASRTRPPELELRLDDAGLAVAPVGGGDPIARATWLAIIAVPQRYLVRGQMRYSMPVLELTIGDHEPLRVAVWNQLAPWPDDAPRVRPPPRWLVGAPQWTRLVAALRAHHRLP